VAAPAKRERFLRIQREVVACRRCPRLVEWRERVAREKVRRFRDETYWGRPVPGFGDPDARILLIGLAPAARPAPEWVAAATTEAATRAQAEVGPRIRTLLDADIDEQRTTPLALLRTAVRYPGAVLAAAGVPPVDRDAAQVRLFPDDVYDLTPATFADVDPALAEPGTALNVVVRGKPQRAKVAALPFVPHRYRRGA